MAVTSDSAQADTPPTGSATRRAPTGASMGMLKRFLTLREGSIIVVTLITIDLLQRPAPTHFVSTANFKTILPYFAPLAIMAAGEVFVMIAGRDRPVDRRRCTCSSPILYYEIHNWRGPRSAGDDRVARDRGDAPGRVQRLHDRLRRNRLVRRHARDAVRARRGLARSSRTPTQINDPGHEPRRRDDVRIRSSVEAPTRSCHLGDRDRACAPISAVDLHPLRGCTRCRSAATVSRPPKPGSTRAW